jgi:outer membrane receptor for Fe3+-dicitrate
MSNDLEVFPEVQDDRFRLNFNGATSKGLELYLKYDKGRKFSWWASYALSYTKDNIRSLVYKGQEYTEFADVYPGRYDQRHAFYLDMNYRPNRLWHFYISWQYHSGWPYTELVLKSAQDPNGSVFYYSTYEDLNGTNYSAYHRLDFRVNRHFYLSRGRLSIFLALINVYNHENVRNIDYSWVWDNPTSPRLEKTYEYWFKLLPSIGINWSWNH